MPVTEDTKPNDNLGGFTNYKQKYGSMKSKLKAILYENELFQDELRKLQRELLDIYRDKETLLERVIQFEDVGSSSSDSESQASDKECEIKSIKNEPQAVPTSNNISVTTAPNVINIKNDTNISIKANNNKPKPASSSKRRNASPSTTVTAAKRNNNGNISTNTGLKPTTNGSNLAIQTNIITTPNKIIVNDASGKNGAPIIIKTDSQPTNGGSAGVATKSSTPAVSTVASVTSKSTPATKPKAPSRSRSKAATNAATTTTATVTTTNTSVSKNANKSSANKNGTKNNGSANGPKVTVARTQEQKVNNNSNNGNSNNSINSKQTKTSNTGDRVQIKANPSNNRINLISQVVATTMGSTTIGNNNLVPSIQTIGHPANHNLGEHFQQQQQPMTVISGHVPITTTNQLNLVPQVTTMQPALGGNLVPSIQTLARQPTHTIGDQYHHHHHQQQQQQQPMTVISNRVPITANQINLLPQVVTTIGPISGNNLMPSIQTIAGQANHNLSEHFQHQMIQQHHPQHITDPQTTIALGIDNSQQQQLQQPIMTTQSNQAVWWWQQQQQQQQQPQQQQTAPTHQIVTSNGHLMRHQAQHTDDTATEQIDHNLNQGCSTPQDVLDSYNSPGQQQQQHPHQSESQQNHIQQSHHNHHQHNITDSQQQSSSSMSNHLSEQSKQDLNQQQQHQQNNVFPTQQLSTTEQLSAEELDQHLESRRMEQAALLLPDWETSVPSEIFNTDSAIKFMAED